MDPREYYCQQLYVEYIWKLIRDLNERFQSHKILLFSFMDLMPGKMTTDDEFLQSNIQTLYDFYNDDLLSGCTEKMLIDEIKSWQKKFSTVDQKPKNALEALEYCHPKVYPNVYSLLLICATLPITTCRNEQSFSVLKSLKDYERNKCGEERLNGIALQYIYKDKTEFLASVDEVLNEFARNPRRFDFGISI